MPFAGFKDFDDCVRKNQDKANPKAFCATIQRQVEKNQMETFAEFLKIDEERREVFGWAYIAIDKAGKVLVDKQADFVDIPEELEDAAYPFVTDIRRGDGMHTRKNTAVMIESVVFTPDKIEKMGLPTGVVPQLAWWVGFKVLDDETWDLVKSGVLKGFSIGGSGKRESVDANSIV